MATTPAGVLKHKEPTKGFLVPLSANEYGIQFRSFVIQDYKTKKTIFEVSQERPLPIDVSRHDASDPDSLRKINYELSDDFLRLPAISTTLVFSVGQRPVSKFRMIERHYFRTKLIKSFDFSFGFVIPGSTNTWEAVYDLPPMDSALIDDMIAHPYETSSDSFYFVDDKLIMHNKAYYKYVREDATAQCKSYEHKYGPSSKTTETKAAFKAQAKDKHLNKGTAGAKAEAKFPQAKQVAVGGSKQACKADVWSKESDYL